MNISVVGSQHIVYIVRMFLCGTILISCNKEAEVPVVPVVPVNFIYEETFEGSAPFTDIWSQEVGDWDYALQFVNDPVFEGTGSVRFEIRKDQDLVANGKRSEVVIVKGTEGRIGEDTWYSFAVYLPKDDYLPDHELDVISQWHNDGSPVRLLTESSKFKLDIGDEKGNKEEIDIGELTTNKWHEFVFHFIHSNGAGGLIEVWLNGEKKIARSGGNAYNNELPKWKVGVYKSAFEKAITNVDKRVIYFDNIRIGGEEASYGAMSPSFHK